MSQLLIPVKKISSVDFVKHKTKRPTPIASFPTVSSLLTLFSKFFSSFLHSTCSLSDSHRYLALDEVYHPIRAAIPNYSTLRTFLVNFPNAKYGGITLSATVFQTVYALGPFKNRFYSLQRINKFILYSLSFSMFVRHY